MDDNFKHRLKNWVDKREAQNRMRIKDITHVVDPGRLIPKEDQEDKDHNYQGRKIREYVTKRLNELVVNKSEELDKGAKGDWQKEGYRLEHGIDRHGFHDITAYDSKSNPVGYAKFSFEYAPDELETGLVATDLKGWDVYVHPDHQRKGLASAMYKLAEEKTGKKITQGLTTPEGSAFWSQLNRSFGKHESLEKGAKELKAMYGTNIQPHQEDFVNWATQKLPGNNNWQKWAVKNHAKNPDQFNKETMQAIEHYGQAGQHIPDVKSVKFLEHNIKQGLQAFKDAENKYNAKALSNPQLIVPDKKTTKLMDVGDGYAWFNLNTYKCDKESKAMGHCGTAAKENQKLLSLRRVIKAGGKEYHEPAVTASLSPDGSLGQMKGRANLIPQQKYHKYVSELFARTKITPPKGDEYLPGNNFNLDDLSHEEHDALLAKRPELRVYSSRISPEKHIELSKNPKNHLNLALNPNLHPEAQAKLAQSQNEDVQRGLALNPNLHPEAQTKLAQSHDELVQRYLAGNPNLHPELQTKLAQSQYVDVQRSLALNPNLHPELQTKLAQSQNKYVQRYLAENPNLHPELQTKLAQSQDEYVHYSLAGNPNLHPELQTKLAQSQSELVQRSLAKNPNLLPELQTKLAQSQDKDVQRSLALNPNLHPEAQTKLAQSQDEYVQRYLAENPNLHPEAQTKLAQSQYEYVQRGLAGNPNLHPELQTKLAQSQYSEVQHDLAENPNLHPELQTKLAQSPNEFVQHSLARNPNLLPELQTKLAQSQNKYVQRGLALNPKVDPKIKKQAIKKLQELNPELAEETINKLKLEKIKLESDNNLKARELRVKEYFDRFKEKA